MECRHCRQTNHMTQGMALCFPVEIAPRIQIAGGFSEPRKVQFEVNKEVDIQNNRLNQRRRTEPCVAVSTKEFAGKLLYCIILYWIQEKNYQ